MPLHIVPIQHVHHIGYISEKCSSLFQLDHLPPSPLCHLPFCSWLLIYHVFACDRSNIIAFHVVCSLYGVRRANFQDSLCAWKRLVLRIQQLLARNSEFTSLQGYFVTSCQAELYYKLRYCATVNLAESVQTKDKRQDMRCHTAQNSW
jgi:hypothetical protein